MIALVFVFYFFTNGHLERTVVPSKWGAFDSKVAGDCQQLGRSEVDKMMKQEQEDPNRILINIIPKCLTDDEFDKEMEK